MFLIAKRRRPILVIIRDAAEAAIALPFIKGNGRTVAAAHFEAHERRTASARCLFAGLQQCAADIAAAKSLVDSDRIKPGYSRAFAESDETIARDRAAILRDEQRGAGRGEEITQAAPRQPVAGKALVFDPDQGGEIGLMRFANRHWLFGPPRISPGLGERAFASAQKGTQIG